MFIWPCEGNRFILKVPLPGTGDQYVQIRKGKGEEKEHFARVNKKTLHK